MKRPKKKAKPPAEHTVATYETTATSARTALLRAINKLSVEVTSLAEDVALNTWETQAVHERLDKIEPTLKTLEQERQRRIGVKQFLNDWRVWLGVVIAAAASLYARFGGGAPPTPPGHP